MKPTTPKALLMGASARAIAAFTMIPFTVLKTRWLTNSITKLTIFPRYESGRFTYMSLGSGLGQILRTEGLTGLYRGLGPTLIRCNNYIWSQIFR